MTARPWGGDTADTKRSKPSVDFGPAKNPRGDRCAVCAHGNFSAADPGADELGTCSEVAGMVRGGDWCVLFERAGT